MYHRASPGILSLAAFTYLLYDILHFASITIIPSSIHTYIPNGFWLGLAWLGVKRVWSSSVGFFPLLPFWFLCVVSFVMMVNDVSEIKLLQLTYIN